MGEHPEQIVVTEALIRQAMSDAPLKTHQRAVSLPVIQRFVDYVLDGKTIQDYKDRIQVDDDRIVDGNHRYIAGRILGYETPSRPGRLPDRDKNAPIQDWQSILIDPVDWGNK